MRKEYELEFDGYSNYIVEQHDEVTLVDFTLTIVCTPYTYESCESGLLSCYDEKEQGGIAVTIGKRGIVRVKIGTMQQIILCESLKEHLRFQQKNIITVAFWGTAGWMDLYVNGVLSNRRQFGRHSSAHIQTGRWYIGKYVNGTDDAQTAKHGIFHGMLRSIDFEQRYLEYDAVCRLHEKELGETVGTDIQVEGEKQEIDLYAGLDFRNDWYRPVYHLMAPGKWMNEPHAPFYYHGRYHIFYQANPHAPVWDNLSWGHLVSDDMVKWRDGGIAMYPDTVGLDIDGVWSGSACLDQNGDPVLFYTAGNNEELPNQSVAIARAVNLQDPMLRKWSKQGIVVRQKQGEGFIGEFRDPFVWRHENIYYMLVGTGDAHNGGGNALLYTSMDLKNYSCHGFVMEYDYESCTKGGHVWELPVLLPLKNEGGEFVCDILLFCACQVEQEEVETYYYLGKFDYERGKFQKYHEKPRLLDVGRGVFTGPSGFVTCDGRSVVFTIAQGKRDYESEYQSGWAHNGGMPVELSICKDELHVRPIREIKQYFNQLVLREQIAEQDYDRNVSFHQMLIAHRLTLKSSGTYLEWKIRMSHGEICVSYDKASSEFIRRNTAGEIESTTLDQEHIIEIGEEDIRMECYVDHSLVEIYLNDRKSMTFRSYLMCEGNTFLVRTDGNCTVTLDEWDAKII
ncbi:MAG: glycoside hydrolase family 32 protein [Lachnospiraceae bacterium]|nr:glycoside hydrolase family 32 protein [Lachnospiraceae bacterium]